MIIIELINMPTLIQNFFENKINNTDTFFKLMGIVAFLAVTIDFMWIQLVMKDQYNKMIPDIQNDSMIVRILPTLLAYVTIILSILLFALPRISRESRIKDSLLYGGFLGVLMYGMFSFTNYAIISKWNMKVVLLDVMWGFILYSVVSYLSSLFMV